MVPISNIYLFFQFPSVDAYSSCALEIEFLQWHTGVINLKMIPLNRRNSRSTTIQRILKIGQESSQREESKFGILFMWGRIPIESRRA